MRVVCLKIQVIISLFNLVQYVKDNVSTKFGITLEEEIIFIGDFTK